METDPQSTSTYCDANTFNAIFAAALAANTSGVALPHVHMIITIEAIILITVNPVVAYHFFLILFLDWFFLIE